MRVHSSLLLVLIGTIGLMAASALAIREYRQTAKVERIRLEQDADRHFNLVTSHLAERESLAGIVASLFKPPPAIGAHGLAGIGGRVLRNAPDIHSLTWIPRVREQETEQAIAAIRAMNIDNPQLRNPQLASNWHKPIEARELASDFFALLDIEPKTPENLAAIGCVVSASPVLRETIEKAWRTGYPAATAPVKLAKLRDALGVILYSPVSAREADVNAPPLGYLGFIYRPETLIGAADSLPQGRFAIRMYDADQPGSGDIFRSGPASAWSRAARPIVRATTFGGRVWTAEYVPLVPPGSLAWSNAVRIAGLSLVGVLAVLWLAAYLSGVSRRLALALDARTAAEERSQTIIRELNHRIKNTLSMVQAIVQRSLTRGVDVEEARGELERRIMAMAHAADLLSQTEWRGLTLRELVSSLPFSERVRPDGPDFRLKPEAAQNMALLFHELCTNATKHGALSMPAGSVALDWRIEEDTFQVSWIERDGPQVQEPMRLGFGRQLIERIVPTAFGGHALVEFNPDGFRYELEAPLKSLVAEERPSAPPVG